MKSIRIVNPGQNYQLALVDALMPRPGADEVLIKVAAAGINRADVMQASRGYHLADGVSDVPGLEVSGEIAEVGRNVQDWCVGDQVCALLSGGGYAEYAVAPVGCVLPVPAKVSLVDAAALPEVYFTVWTNLFDAARLKDGESVLIHGGASGIGTAAIQLCEARGHRVFTTAGTLEKCTACEGLGAEKAIHYREEDFAERIMAITDGEGVDVILDMVGGSYVQKNIEIAKLWGRIVNVAYQSGYEATINFAPVLTKRLSLLATTLRTRTNSEKADVAKSVGREVWPLLDSGRIRAVVDSVHPLVDAGNAHARMIANGHTGKILLRP